MPFEYLLAWAFVAIALLGVVYLLLLIPRYEKYHRSNVSVNLTLPPLTGYASPTAYHVGDLVQLFVHAEEDYTGEVYRVGQGTFTKVYTFSAAACPQEGRYRIKSGHDWSVTHTLPTAGWSPSFYLIRLLSNNGGEAFSVPLLLRAASGNEVLVVAPTNTWQKYNVYGGKSNYRDEVTPSDLTALFKVLERISPPLGTVQLPAHPPAPHPTLFPGSPRW